MRILYFVQYLSLPDEPGGSRPYQFARAWTQAGHQVTIITGNVNYNTLEVRENCRGRLITEEVVDGIRVLRVWVYARTRGSFKKRYLNFLSYAITASIAAFFRGGGADLVYASSTPLTAVVPGYVAARLRRAPFYFEVRDLWPESAIVAGALRPDSPVARGAAWLAGFFYKRAARLPAVTRGIADGLRVHGVPEEKILLIPNGVDDWMAEAAQQPPPPSPPQPQQAAARDRFQIVYCGAHGIWNGLSQIIDAAAILRDETGIEFLFVGDGDERAALTDRVRREGLASVRFLGAVPKREAFRRLQSASATIIVTWDHPFQRMVLANKLFDYLAAGHPVIVGADGEMAELVRDAGAGVVVPPNRPDLLAGAIRTVHRMSAAERDRMGEKGRLYILEHYRRADLARKLEQSFARTVAERKGKRRREPSAVAG